MCGIAGIVDPNLAPDIRAQAVRRMCAAMVHRGPDDEGHWEGATATLGMRRLAVFDPAGGSQPMRSPDGRHTLVFNGAIYNFRALRAELAGTWNFRTKCDTEALLAVCSRWGVDGIPRLRGMYAFALWDDRAGELLLARDPFGIKPLYFHHDGARLVFASEVSALFASGLVPSSPDPRALADHLAWLAVPAPRTLHRGVFCLRPGECARLRGSNLEILPTWSFQDIPETSRPCRTRTEFVGELRARLEDSVRAHLAADVPVGAFLSGGLDSAVVTSLMIRASGTRLRTFSIDFAERDFSEADEAAATARHLGANHHAELLTGARVAGDIDRLLAAFDQPSGDGINTYYASHAARAGGVTVALSGLGGDELFGGYPSFRDIPRLLRWLPVWRALPAPLRRPLVSLLDRGDTRARKLADLLAHARDPHQVAALQRRVFSSRRATDLLAPDLRPRPGDDAPPFHPSLPLLASDLDPSRPFELASGWELRTYMADVLLRDSDMMSMRHSLELRVPLLDRPLLEWLWRQPAEFKHDPAHPKSALREAVSDLLPPGMEKRRKRGFTLPFALWMKRELRPFLEDTFAAANVARSGLFDTSAVRAVWSGFLTGNDQREWSRLWSLAMLIAFVNRPPPSVRAP